MIRIKDLKDCCGCTACASICAHNAIAMTPDSLGFKYPKLDTSRCVNCGLCESVCPQMTQTSRIEYQKIVAAATPMLSERMKSSSGGMFYLLAKYVIENKGKVFGVVYDDEMNVKHVMADRMEDIERMRTSKYVQSDLNGIYKQVRNVVGGGGNFVLFVGTPCQVSGLRQYLRKDYENLILVDLICHGVPSPWLFSQYISFVELKRGKKIVSINMKDKAIGWLYPRPRIMYDDGTNEINTLISNMWPSWFYSHLAVRPSCHNCLYTNFNRVGDITLGDWWGIEKHRPDLLDNTGINLCILNNTKGDNLFNKVVKHYSLSCHEVKADQCTQQALSYPAPVGARRDEFLIDIKNLSFKELSIKYINYTNYARLKYFIKSRISAIGSLFKAPQ